MKKLFLTINALLVLIAISTPMAVNAAIVDACASESPSTGSNLTNGDAICVPNGTNSNSIQYYYIQVPANTSTLYIRTAHGSGNGNLYYNASTWATASANSQSSTNSGNTESINVSNPAQGYRFMSVVGQQSGMTLLVTTTNPDSGSSSGGSSSGGSSSGGSSSGGSSSGGSSSGGSSSGGSSSGGLSNGQTVTGLSASQGQYTQAYYIDVPSGASDLKIAISGGSGDADLYVKKGSEPTDNSYDCRPYDSGNNETCGVGGDTLATSQGRFYIKLKAYSTFSGVSLTASYTGGGSSSGGSSSGGSSSGGSSSGGSSSGGSSSGGSSSGGSSSGGLSNGQTVTGLSASQGQYTQAYYIDVPSGASDLKIAISGGSGDADLYVKKGSEPTDNSYDCRPYDSGNNETCGVGGDTLATSQGRFYIKLKAYSTFSGVSLTASYTGGGSSSGGSSSGGSSSGGSSSGGSVPNACSSESPHSGNVITLNDAICVPNGTASNDIEYYQINLANSVSQLQIRTAHGGGDAELLYRKADWANSSSYDQISDNSGNSESITINNAAAGYHYISVVGEYNGLTLLVSGDGGSSSSGGSSGGGSSSGGDTLPDVCATQDPFSGSLTDGVPVCVPSSNWQQGYGISTVNVGTVNSIAFSSAHGLGNLTMEVNNSAWPTPGDDSIRSKHIGNTECVVLTNPGNGWNYVNLKGLFKGASVVADFNRTTCRVTPGADDPGNIGYEPKNVNLLIFRFNFNGTPIPWTESQINEEMTKAKTYFDEQSYGNFNLTWEVRPAINLSESKSQFDNDKSSWGPFYRQKLIDAGVDPYFPGEGTLIMVTSHWIGPSQAQSINSQAGPPLMEIYHHNGSTVSHELGHAVGLRHAMSVEAGSSVLSTNMDTNVIKNYGNVMSMMGGGGWTYEEFNLMYKSYFKDWISDADVPVINSSGTYRIYAFDYGTAAGTNAPGDIGIRLKSGNGLYTYWLEYRTYHDREDFRELLLDTVTVNVQGLKENETDPAWWNHRSALLDFTPNSKPPANDTDLTDFWDAGLKVNQSFTDPWNGFRITPKATGGALGTADAWIEIEVEKF